MAKHIHLIGICGSAMASLAGMLQTKGYLIMGSDVAAYPPMLGPAESHGHPHHGALCGSQSLATP